MDTKVKDTALAAMKRAARAILKDELKALKQAVKDAHEERKEAAEGFLQEMETMRRSRDHLMRSVSEWQARVIHMNEQLARAKRWQEKFAPTDKALEASLQYITRPAPTGSWVNSSCVCPFARWGFESPDNLK